MADKDYTVFDRVVRVKIDGWRALLAARERFRARRAGFACCFTSVAGRLETVGKPITLRPTPCWMPKWLA